ncbi:MAG: hypothetical protein V3T05_08735 [Myxococcota bacterium]
MRILLALSIVAMLAACGDQPSPVAEIGWRFDYKDYRDADAAEDLRACDNAPPSHVGPAYSPIETVTINIQDPERQVPGIDNKVFQCAQGTSGDRVPIRGIVKQIYELTIEAKSAGGAVLYRYEDAEFDLSTEVAKTFVLDTATGELSFFPTYDGRDDCPAGVDNVSYALYQIDDGTPATDPTVKGVLPQACVADGLGNMIPKKLFIREIPVDVDPIDGQQFVSFRLLIEARDGSASNNVLHCVDENRSVRPGNSSVTMSNNAILMPGTCP